MNQIEIPEEFLRSYVELVEELKYKNKVIEEIREDIKNIRHDLQVLNPNKFTLPDE